MKSIRPGSTRLLPLLAALGAAYGLTATPAFASSHREAPSITTTPKVDATDFYMFNSYEGVAADGTGGRSGFVTIIADYQPLQNPGDGPNYYKMDPNALYEIHIDNVGDAHEHITFQFKFQNKFKATALTIGTASVAIPLTQSGVVSAVADPNLNVTESYTVDIVRGDRRTGTHGSITNVANGSATFDKPSDNIGTKTIPNYAAYAALHVFQIAIPGCSSTTPGKVFVGQRKDPFAVNLGTIFDLVNAPASFVTDPTQKDAATDTLKNKNVTSIAIEVPTSCLTTTTDPVIGGWTSASLRQGSLLSPVPKSGYQTTAIPGGAWTQVSRLGMPLVNEVVIGLPDKDKFNGSVPSGDAQFATYVTNPTLPALISTVLNVGAIAPTNFPRTDLVTAFLTGIPSINQQKTVTPSEMLRLNTSIPAVPFGMQNRLGIVGNILASGSDSAGYPNGRRPNDDVVDISLVAMMGGLCVANGTANALGFGAACTPSVAPLGTTAFNLHDGVDQAGPKVTANAPLLPAFPYIATPLAGAGM